MTSFQVQCNCHRVLCIIGISPDYLGIVLLLREVFWAAKGINPKQLLKRLFQPPVTDTNPVVYMP